MNRQWWPNGWLWTLWTLLESSRLTAAWGKEIRNVSLGFLEQRRSELAFVSSASTQ